MRSVLTSMAEQVTRSASRWTGLCWNPGALRTAGVGAALATAVVLGATGPAAARDDAFKPVEAAPLFSPDTQVLMAAALANDPFDSDNDPLEGLNRAVFFLNQILEVWFLRPASTAYEAFLPPPVRNSIDNVIDNLRSPVTLANDVLQGEWDRAGNTVARMGINTTMGIGGLFDAAAENGFPKHEEDFGQTLAVWGTPEPFYLVLPLLGPSNPRDAVGKFLVDGYFDPFGLWLTNTHREPALWSMRVLDGLEKYTGVRDDLDNIRKTSVDFYAALRSLYRQKRLSDINNGRTPELAPIPDLGDLDLNYGDDEQRKADAVDDDNLSATPAAPSAE